MTIKVLHVIARMNLGGTSTYLNNLILSSQELDIEHLIVIGNVQGDEIEDPRILQLPHIRIHQLGRSVNLIRDVASWWKIWRIIRKYQPDVINSHTFKAGFLTRLIPTVIPIIHTFHGHLLDDPEFSVNQKRLIVRIERLLAHRAKILTVTGEKVRKELSVVRIHHPRWVCIVPGIKDLTRIERNDALQLIGLADFPKSKLIIGWHSRFAHVKNVPLIMSVAIQNSDCLFLLSGGGPLFSHFQREHPKNVHLLGWQSPEVVFSNCDLVISTSYNEGLPFSLIEASLMGLPCIATAVGGTEEIVLDGITGFTVSANANEITKKIRLLAENSELRLRMGSKAREHALSNFGFEVFADKYLQLAKEATQ